MGLRSAGDTYMGFRAAMMAGVGRPVLRFAIEAVRGLASELLLAMLGPVEVRLLPDVVGPTALHQPASDWLPVEDARAILPGADKPRCSGESGQRPEPAELPGRRSLFFWPKSSQQPNEPHSERIPSNTAAPRPRLSVFPAGLLLAPKSPCTKAAIADTRAFLSVPNVACHPSAGCPELVSKLVFVDAALRTANLRQSSVPSLTRHQRSTLQTLSCFHHSIGLRASNPSSAVVRPACLARSGIQM